jgi:hypothetical protein
MNAAESMAVREAAEHYLSLGWRIVPVPHAKKAPTMKGWPECQVDTNGLVTAFPEPSNIGVILGAVSGGLVDIDLDCPEAVELAPESLPDTWLFGRASKPRSHYLYVVRVIAIGSSATRSTRGSPGWALEQFRIAPRAPWQNGLAERFVGSIRRAAWRASLFSHVRTVPPRRRTH